MKDFKGFHRFFCIIAALVMLLTGVASVQAAMITVTANAADVLNGADASCALREAITNINNSALTYADCANTGAAYGTSDTINIPAGTYTTAIAGIGEDLNATGDYDILKSVTIVGAGSGSTTVNGGGLDGVFNITGAYTVSISGVTITGGNTAGWGGGIYNSGGTLAVTNSTITSNASDGFGGGIFNNGTVTVTNSTITGNTAANQGGGIHNANTLTVTSSTITSNTATNGGGGIASNTAATVTNSTISGNTTTSFGGGIGSSGTLTVTNSTIVRNIAPAGWGGGIYKWVGGTATFTNSVVADNGVGADCVGAITNSGGNIDKDSTCTGFTHSVTMVQGTGFSALASNGGPTQTHALLAGSAAIDTAPTCAGLTTDQRGTARPQGSACDVGAYEYVVPQYTVTPSAGAGGTISPSTPQTVNSGSTTAFTVTPNAGYTASVGGTCGGALVGTTYTTNAITADCTVAATFTQATPAAIPTLSEWGLILLAGLLGLFGMGVMRRRSKVEM